MTQLFCVGDFIVPLDQKLHWDKLPEEYATSYCYGINCGQVGRVVEIVKHDYAFEQVVMICHHFIKEPDDKELNLDSDRVQFGLFAGWQNALPSFCLRKASEEEIKVFNATQIFENYAAWDRFCDKLLQETLEKQRQPAAPAPPNSV